MRCRFIRRGERKSNWATIRYAVAIGVAFVPVFAVAGQSDEGPPRWAANIARKQQVIMRGLPPEYRSIRDPSPDTNAKVMEGAAVFDRNCAACHGWTGQGSGPEAFALVPAPADLEWLAGTPKDRAEPYMYWTIAGGGSAFESDMPAFKQRLSRDEIFAVIAYVRAGLPRRSP